MMPRISSFLFLTIAGLLTLTFLTIAGLLTLTGGEAASIEPGPEVVGD